MLQILCHFTPWWGTADAEIKPPTPHPLPPLPEPVELLRLNVCVWLCVPTDCVLIVCLSVLFSQGNTSAQPGTNGAVDTDELILNIQRLYAASRRGGFSDLLKCTLPLTEVGSVIC